MKTFLGHLKAFGISFLLVASATASPNYPLRPPLVVFIVIDQFRADYLTRFRSSFLPARPSSDKVGGFQYLLEESAYYPFAEYGILQCMTGPGHATISTGSYPYQSGHSLNYWYDRDHKKGHYCVEDSNSLVIPASVREAVKKGLSPRTLWTTTLGDELKNAGYSSRVVSIALKDRAAILMGGHRADQVYWFEPTVNQWLTSEFYLKNQKALPPWVQEINKALETRRGSSIDWSSQYATGVLTEPKLPFFPGKWIKKLGTDFPHPGKVGGMEAGTLPFGVEITRSLAERAVQELQLGKGKHTDLLWVSFSTHDYLGHAFGPNSREMEEITLIEDRQISQLLNSLKKHLGQERFEQTWFVLTGDHGSPTIPEWLTEKQVPAGRINDETIANQIHERLNSKFGAPPGEEKWVEFVRDLNFYLNHNAIEKLKLKASEVEKEAQKVIQSAPGIAHVFSRTQMTGRDSTASLPGRFAKLVSRTYVPSRNGDLIALPHPYFETGDDSVEHMTPHAYDRMVPLILKSGKKGPFVSGVFSQKAEVTDITPTIAWLLGILPPPTSEGRVLTESLRFTRTTPTKN